MQISAPLEDTEQVDPENFTPEIEVGLLATSAFISPKFLYDPLGSHLFTAITLLPEYYPTSTEKSIIEQYKHEIAHAVTKGGTLIDLGAGNCQKAESLLDSLNPSAYIAIDFSVEYLKEALSKLQGKYPQIAMQAIGMDFSHKLSIPNSVPSSGRTFFYPGSSIGNFLSAEAQKLLTEIKHQAGDGGLLIGVDLMKEEAVLKDAYDDPLKVTAAFNLNILRSIYVLIGSNFNVEKFQHVVRINHQENRVELYLEALEDVLISWPGNSRSFKKGECIHTENSHKYTIDSIKRLLKSSGFASTQIWTDPKDYFAVIYAQ